MSQQNKLESNTFSALITCEIETTVSDLCDYMSWIIKLVSVQTTNRPFA